MTMQDDAYLKCIDSQCGLEYPIKSTNLQCDKGHMLDVKYKNKPSDKLKDESDSTIPLPTDIEERKYKQGKQEAYAHAYIELKRLIDDL